MPPRCSNAVAASPPDPESGRAVGEGATLADTPATLTWQKLKVVATNTKGASKVILDEVTGYVEPCHMLAIMGPSGCGKTTLLDTLAGRLPSNVDTSGEVRLNGHQSRLTYGVSAYVTQDEVLVGTLSVRETLLYTARLKLPASLSRAHKVRRVDEVISELGLENAQHTKIGTPFIKGVSGGQKRRVSIGCELVTHPTLVFLDEPTSGLDAASAYYVMATVRALAQHQRTILTVIHQPSSEVFELFDKLCLLSGGRVVYFGDAAKALSLFEEAGVPCPPLRNPTDHFLHVINTDFVAGKVDGGKAEGSSAHGQQHVEEDIERLITLYNTTRLPDVQAQAAQLSAPGEEYTCSTCGAGWLAQSLVLTERMLINNWRNVAVFWLRLAMYMMLCICIGTIFLKLGDSWVDTYSRTAVMFFIVAFLTFMAIAGFPAFVEDMQVFMRERLNGYYGVSTFAIANTLASAPFILGIAMISSAIAYFLIGLNVDGDRYVYFNINLYVALMVVESMMMAIAAVVPHYLMGIAGGAGMLGMFMLVCGFFQPVEQLPKPVWRYPLHYMSFHSYSFAGFMRNEFESTGGWACPCTTQMQGCGPQYNATNPCVMSGEEVLDYWSIGGAGNKWVDIGIMIAMIAIYRIMFWLALTAKEKMR